MTVWSVFINIRALLLLPFFAISLVVVVAASFARLEYKCVTKKKDYSDNIACVCASYDESNENAYQMREFFALVQKGVCCSIIVRGSAIFQAFFSVAFFKISHGN